MAWLRALLDKVGLLGCRACELLALFALVQGLAGDLLFAILTDGAKLGLRLLVLRSNLLTIVVQLLICVGALRTVHLAIGLVLIKHRAEDVLPLVRLLRVALRVPLILGLLIFRHGL